MVFLWVMTAYSLVYWHWHFGVTYCPFLQKNLEVRKMFYIPTISKVPDYTMSLPCKRQIAPGPHTQILTVRQTQAAGTSASRERTRWLSVSCEDHLHWPVCRLLQATEVTLLLSSCLASLLLPSLPSPLLVTLQQCSLLMPQHYWNALELTKSNSIPLPSPLFHFHYNNFLPFFSRSS
jgi:hypothetical protein